jgi:pullulanase
MEKSDFHEIFDRHCVGGVSKVSLMGYSYIYMTYGISALTVNFVVRMTYPFPYEAVNEWAAYLNKKYPEKKLLVFGEPWEASPGPEVEDKMRLGKLSYLAEAHVGAFNNQFRYAIKGDSDDGSRGYMFNSMFDYRGTWDIEVGMRGSLATSDEIKARGEWEKQFAMDPEQTINYITAHDNYNLYDKISTAGVSDDSYASRIGKFGNGIVLTAQGIPFLHSGEEFRRSKAVGDYKEHSKNSYMWGTQMNKINWSDKEANYDKVFDYYRDLIELRKAHPGLRLRTREEINRRITKSYTVSDRKIVVAEIDEDNNIGNGPELIVVYNPSWDYNVGLPSGRWRKIFDINGKVNLPGDNKCEGTAVTILEKY